MPETKVEVTGVPVCYYCYYGRCDECQVETPAGYACACNRPKHEELRESAAAQEALRGP